MAQRFRSKLMAGFLGLFFGILGAHRAYLGQPMAWVYPVLALPLTGHALREPEWWWQWSAFAVGILLVLAWLETIRIALTPVERWDARYNAGAERRSRASVWSVVIACVALMIGTIVLMTVMALGLQSFFEFRYGLR
ncbi:MAG: TM2 domain-containing protein [Burkholderiaceae bacterium]